MPNVYTKNPTDISVHTMFQRMKNKGNCGFKSMYATKREFTPAVVVEAEDEDTGEIFTVLEKVVKPKKRKYLPGERLMLKLNKQKEKERETQREKQRHGKTVQTSLHNVLGLFA
jgi:hypothetical protein